DKADHLSDGAVGSQHDSATAVHDHERRNRDEINVLKPPDLPLNVDAAAVIRMRAKGSDGNLDFLSPPAPGYRRHCCFPPGKPGEPLCLRVLAARAAPNAPRRRENREADYYGR